MGAKYNNFIASMYMWAKLNLFFIFIFNNGNIAFQGKLS